jgi:uncharacterized protein
MASALSAMRSQTQALVGEVACPHSVSSPLMDQDWRSLSFLHWRYEPAVVGQLLPAGVTLETFDGAAWVSLVPFLLRVRIPRGPLLPWLGVFPETNVRTYVRGPDGESGIWFLSLDAPRRLAVWAARRTYHLPYHRSAMRLHHDGNTRSYASRRLSGAHRGASSSALVTLQERVSAHDLTALEIFLTARWRLYAPLRGRIGTARVHHAPYRLWHATATDIDAGLFVAASLPAPVGDALVHGCDDVSAAMSRLTRCPSDRGQER